LKTYEEANCTVAGGCSFTFTSTLPEITAVSPVFDNSLKAWTVEVSGTGFTGTVATTEFLVDSQKQPTLSVSATKAVFQITNVTSNLLDNLKLYFDIGVPKGFEMLDSPIVLQPRMVAVTPNSGSSGLTSIVASVPGVGTEQTGLSIVDSTGSSVCSSLDVVEYGKVLCRISSKTDISTTLNVKLDAVVSDAVCSGTACDYSQSLANSASYPSVSAITSDQQTITFSGTFATTGFSVSVSYSSIKAETVTFDSSSIVATWNYGLPISSSAILPEVTFKHVDGYSF
jgi:hypothetical protein